MKLIDGPEEPRWGELPSNREVEAVVCPDCGSETPTNPRHREQVEG